MEMDVLSSIYANIRSGQVHGPIPKEGELILHTASEDTLGDAETSEQHRDGTEEESEITEQSSKYVLITI